jgi:nucleotidyltransferase/DNA polymerase involved in DNA repair
MAVIALVDCNNFYASCEQLMNPKLIGKPVCVTSNNNGCVVARSKEAKELGVRMGMPVFMAKKEFKDIIYIQGRLGLYGEISQRIMATLRNYTPDVEEYSIDEAFLDLTGLRRLYRKSYFEIAQDIQKHISDDIGIPVSIGIAPTKVLAKLATERAKSSFGVYQIGTKGTSELLRLTNLSEIWGVGKNTAALMGKYGVRTASQFVAMDNSIIQKLLGKKGLELKEELLGHCISPVDNTFHLPKSIQKTSSFVKCTNDAKEIKNDLHYHTNRACSKLRRLKMKANVVGLMLRTKDFRVIVEKFTLPTPSNCEFEIYKLIDNLLVQNYNSALLYRSSGIYLENLIEEKDEQLSFFYQGDVRQNKLSFLCDELQDKYGSNSIKIGCYSI